MKKLTQKETEKLMFGETLSEDPSNGSILFNLGYYETFANNVYSLDDNKPYTKAMRLLAVFREAFNEVYRASVQKWFDTNDDRIREQKHKGGHAGGTAGIKYGTETLGMSWDEYVKTVQTALGERDRILRAIAEETIKRLMERERAEAIAEEEAELAKNQ